MIRKMLLALVLVVLRLTPSRVAQRAVEAYVSYHRNIPTLVQMMLWYFGLASLLPGWRAYRLSLADGLSPRT